MDNFILYNTNNTRTTADKYSVINIILNNDNNLMMTPRYYLKPIDVRWTRHRLTRSRLRRNNNMIIHVVSIK